MKQDIVSHGCPEDVLPGYVQYTGGLTHPPSAVRPTVQGSVPKIGGVGGHSGGLPTSPSEAASLDSAAPPSAASSSASAAGAPSGAVASRQSPRSIVRSFAQAQRHSQACAQRIDRIQKRAGVRSARNTLPIATAATPCEMMVGI